MTTLTHLSTFDLDRLLLKRGSDPHLDQCAACQARLRVLETTQAEFVDARGLARGLRKLETRAPQKRWAWIFAPVLAAAALAVFVQTQPDDLAVKGDAVASFYVYRGDTWQPVQKGQVLKSGEGVRVQMHLRSGEGYGLIVEGTGNALLPFNGQAAAPLQKDAADVLFVLDDAHGDERWLVVVSPDQTTLDQAKPALQSLASCPKGARCSWIEFAKEPK